MFRNLVKLLSIIFMITTLMTSYSNTKKASKSIYVLSIQSTVNPEYFRNFASKIYENKTKLDISTEVIKNMPPNVITYISATLNPRPGHRSRPLVSHEMALCDMFAGRNLRMANFLTSFMQDYLSSGNFLKDCPLPKGNYSWHDVTFDNLNIPSYFPSAKYELKSGSYIRQKSKNITFIQVCILLKID